MPVIEKSFALFSVKNCKKTLLSREHNPTTVDEIIIKTVQRGKAEIYRKFWMDKVIDTSKYFYETAWRER